MSSQSLDIKQKVPRKSRGRTALAVVLGIVIGGFLGLYAVTLFVGAQANYVFTTVNGWSIAMQAGKPNASVLQRAVMARVIPGVNVAKEAVYWISTTDSTGQTLNGQHDYILHFPAGGLPPVDAFWSLSMTETNDKMVSNSINRYSVSDHSGLAKNADGSVDIYIQNMSPAGHETNWLPAPSDNFKLWLRAYLPGQAILNGSYQVPPVTEVK